jgi:hypothetical protein
MTFEKEMDRFWKAYNQDERECMESFPPYLEAIKACDPAKAQEIACSFFSLSERKKCNLLKKHGISYITICSPKRRIAPFLSQPDQPS